MSRSGVRVTIRSEGRTRAAMWRDLHALDWSSFALVLGAGGVTGLAFEAGVLPGLGVDHGVELSDAHDLVGTSAGAIVAALAGLGLDARDLAALVAATPQHFSEHAVRVQPSFDPEGIPSTPGLVRMLRPQSPRDVVAVTRLTLRRQYRAAVLRMLRDGSFDMRARIAFLEGHDWPCGRELMICATNSSDGDRVVLNAGTGTALFDAVLASCAVPTVMQSVLIGAHSYVDGGLVSPTNADVLAGAQRASLTVVVSPMSGADSRTVQGVLSARFASTRLRQELARFDGDQTVVVIEPIGELSRLVVDDSLAGVAVKQILRSAFSLASC